MFERQTASGLVVVLLGAAVAIAGCDTGCEVPSAWCEGDVVMKCGYTHDEDEVEEGGESDDWASAIVEAFVDGMDPPTHVEQARDCGAVGLVCVETVAPGGTEWAECAEPTYE